MMDSYVIRLQPGQALREEIESFVNSRNIRAGWIVSCVGSLLQYHIRFANRQEGSLLTGHFEIISLTGTLSVNGCHLHIGLADGEGRMVGGHLLYQNIVYSTAEIVIQQTREMIFLREKDESTGWLELQISRPGPES